MPSRSLSRPRRAAGVPILDRALLLRGVAFKRMTANTVTSRRQFDATLAEVRRSGFAVDRGEALDGVHCVASPILDHQGFPVAALTVTGPADRIPISAFSRLGEAVKQHAAEISKRLGFGLNGRHDHPSS